LPGIVIVSVFPPFVTTPPAFAFAPKFTIDAEMKFVPVSVMLTGWPSTPVVGLMEVRVGTGFVATPTPVIDTEFGLLAALLVTVTLAFFVPEDVGAKFTPMVQVPFAARLLAPERHVNPPVGEVRRLNWLASVPVTAIEETKSVAVPLFCKVIV
jgi:hypothetical protein